MFGLDTSMLSSGMTILFFFCIVMVFAFEFINGFHDTANAVATVIYTKTLEPVTAVVWSGLMNFCGVLFSATLGYTVAMKIANLLPAEALLRSGGNSGQAAAMAIAVLLAAIIWNLGTWYVGIPCSSSHTLIGALLGVGIVFSYLPENVNKVTVNMDEANKIGLSLLISPLFGFSVAIVLMFVLRSFMKTKEAKQIFKEPEPDARPPLWIRIILFCTCTLVSFFHGSNDGQKGLGLLLVILMAFMPLKHALSPEFSQQKAMASLETIQNALPLKDTVAAYAPKELAQAGITIGLLKNDIMTANLNEVKTAFNIRKRISVLGKSVEVLLNEPNVIQEGAARKSIKNELKILKDYTTHIPFWGLMMISLALGIGTMIGWKRIVVTIGEKIGKRHMTYAEGATAELVAAVTIGLSSNFGWPVSTTHVLSSGVAGAMVASKGTKNLQRSTITNIALAWLLTLPVTIILSGGLYLLFRMVL